MKDLIIKISVMLPNSTGDYELKVENVHSKVIQSHIPPAKLVGMMAAGLRMKTVKITKTGQKEAPKPPPVYTLKDRAADLGIKVDGRWSDKRISEEVSKVQRENSAPEQKTGLSTMKSVL